MERAVAVSSHAFGEGVQAIVASAKAKQQGGKNDGEWKIALLKLLGQIPTTTPVAAAAAVAPVVGAKKQAPAPTTSNKMDIDVLLQNSKCDKFVLRCVENELPPNLIHCLRLLRVLELQHANEQQQQSMSMTVGQQQATNGGSSIMAAEHESDGDAAATAAAAESSPSTTGTTNAPDAVAAVTDTTKNGGDNNNRSTGISIRPISKLATAKVARLLCLLCTDSSVGEQLRPHLFGLLALSGASYPPSGVHVAAAASDVIGQFAAHCLTRNLVWFVHDRKMMIHMTDDVKELSGMSASPFQQQPTHAVVPMGLVGEDAEKSGLMVIALRTVVKMVHESLRFETVDLVKDFEAAGGFEVVHYSMLHATGNNGNGLMELIPQLICCPNEVLIDSDEDGDIRKLASNARVFNILADLLTRSNPLLRRKRHEIAITAAENSKDVELQRFIGQIKSEDLRELAMLSVKTVAKRRLRDIENENDNLGVNYDLSSELLTVVLQLIAEHPNNYEILEDRLHVLTFSLLSFPCFDDQDVKSLVLKMLEFVLTAVGTGDEAIPVNACVEIFFALCRTLLKGDIDFEECTTLTDSQKAQVLGFIADDANLMGTQLEKLLQFDQRLAPLMVESGILTENLDHLLRLVSERSSVNFQEPSDTESIKFFPPGKTPLDGTFATVCRVIKLIVADQPVSFSKDVDESSEEKTNLHTLLNLAVKRMGIDAVVEAAGVFEAYMSAFSSTEGLEFDMMFVLRILEQLTILICENNCDLSLLRRTAIVISMLRSVLEAKWLSRNPFRECGGFDVLLRIVLSLKGISLLFDGEEFVSIVMELLQSVMGLLDAAVGMKSRSALTANETSPLAVKADVTVDWISSQLSSDSASSLNRNYLRQKGYYLNFAAALAGTQLLSTDLAVPVVNLIFSHMDPELSLAGKASDTTTVRNPDAIRCAFGVALFLPGAAEGNELSAQLLDRMIRLCEKDSISTTLTQFASCGLCYSLTNPKEFGPILFDREHSLQTRFGRILCRVAAFCMSHMDFTGLLRNVAGPLLATDAMDGRVRLPVISSSVRKQPAVSLIKPEHWSEEVELREHEFSLRLQTICDIAKHSERYPRIKVGGDTVNTIAVLMHQFRLEERLRATAEEGRLKYIEIESVDASALNTENSSITNAGSSPSSAASEKMWTPLAGSGLSFSLWMRHEVTLESTGSFYIFDVCHISNLGSIASNQGSSFLSVWYDLQSQRFNVMSSASYRGEPTCFPVSPLRPNQWHHILLTYTPAKRAMIARKSVFTMFVDGRSLEADVRVDTINLPPSSKVVIGAPNPVLSLSGVIRGSLPEWEVGPTLLLSTVLLDLDATAIFSYGPDFPGLLWGDRPQRLSLSATGTAVFSMLANSGESGSIASALRRRDILKLEAVGYSSMVHTEKDDLAGVGLLCNIPPECVVFGFHPQTSLNKMRNEVLKKDRRVESDRLVNLARLNYGIDSASTDAVLFGRGSLIAPVSFQQCLRWAGGPSLLMPLVNAACSSMTLALSLQIIRLGAQCHRPNLEALQSGGGYRILSVLLQGKGAVDESCLDQCLAFAIDGFDPDATARVPSDNESVNDSSTNSSKQEASSVNWVFSDLDAMKHLLLNHQVWDLKKFGPRIPLRLLMMLNQLVDHKSLHKAFNARRLHQVGIVRWALHLSIEAADLYTAGELSTNKSHSQSDSVDAWFCECPRVAEVSVGGDPGNPFLLECKNLLRRVLTFMLTPGDLEALVESIVFTESINGNGGKNVQQGTDPQFHFDDRILPGATMRLHFVRLLEELIVDGVNEIVAGGKSDTGKRENPLPPHAGGVASPNQPYFTRTNSRIKANSSGAHPKHQQAQKFLSAFSGYLTPVWFATVLEGCQEEASASAVVRLLILMLQGSSTFETSFRNGEAFAPFVLSIPRYSTCPGITITMLSQLLNVPILHLHSLPTLDPEQLREVFDAEADDPEFDSITEDCDPSQDIFALIVECVGRNIHHISNKSLIAQRAAATNLAIVQLLTHRHTTSKAFREFCCSHSFLEPLSQALCLVYDEKLQPSRSLIRSVRPSPLANVPKDLTPTERFVGSMDDPDCTGMGIVRLVRLIMSDSISNRARASQVVSTILRSFPVHASPQQVEAFHLVLIEHCCSAIDGVLLAGQGESLAIANCLGVCSVLLDHILASMLTSEAAIKTVKTTISILNALLRFDTPAIYSLSNVDHSMLTKDAAYLANLMCVSSLRTSLPFAINDKGDDDLQAAVLSLMDTNMESMLLLPSRDRKSNWKVPSAKVTKPSQNSKQYVVWESSSIARCSPDRIVLFPDSFSVENPDVVTTAPLLVSFHRLLLGPRDDVRSLVISILVALLQHRSNLLGELLVAEVSRNGRTETIDVVNRGGFKALLAAHEAASVADRKGPSTVSVKRKYAAFFEWFERNHDEVQLVFDEVNKKAVDLFPVIGVPSTPQLQAVESEQRHMLVKLSARSSDRSSLGGMERVEFLRVCSENTSEIHSQWKRQGFDDLAYGAMKWKIVLRQLKGSSSIWEGGPSLDGKKWPTLDDQLSCVGSWESSMMLNECPELVSRWKLDLTESFERQRRRFLPNYEFHGLYNLEEEEMQLTDCESGAPEAPPSVGKNFTNLEINVPVDFLVGRGQMEATTALLKDLNIKRAHKIDLDEDESELEATIDSSSVATTATMSSMDYHAVEKIADGKQEDAAAEVTNQGIDEKDSSSYELITGLLQAGDWPEKSYNVSRCTGLEVTKALLLWCGVAIYVIDGFEQTGGDGMEGKISRVERERSSFHISLRQKGSKVYQEEKSEDEMSAISEKEIVTPAQAKREHTRPGVIHVEEPTDEVIYEHRSQRIFLTDLYSVYRRRYQLQQSGLEFYDVHRNSVLISFATKTEREEVLSKVLQSSIPNSIFSSGYGTFINYSKFMKNLQTKLTTQWQNGKLTNFEFLMQLNSLAGRSFNDLTQYPVFPWVIADYESEELDLNDPKTYRDLSKPMGALGEERAKQFLDRYDALSSTNFGEDDPPPFHYGTHYSCAAYVLYYLMRLEPFSRLALALQGGRFDVADRLFHDVGRSWKSASSENLQDVRELIPEFFYLPEFLVNTNDFDFGETQRGKTVHDVSLPKWAKGDPKRFVRINRQALESDYVSKNLHHWIDLVFGYKQIGEKAVEALNVFVHVTYEGEVDIDTMTDSIQRQSTIAQIQNFGQTPSRLERWPFPSKTVVRALKEKSIDFGVLASLAPSTPPLCVVGAPHRVHLKFFQADVCKLGLLGHSDKSVGDIGYVKGQVIAVGKMCALIMPSKKYFRFGGLNNGLSVHAAAVSARFRETNKLISMHDDLHRGPISAAKASINGNWLVTGSVDSTVRVWAYEGSGSLDLRATLCGHDGSHIKCLDISTECGVIVSGCGLGRVLLWDLRTLTFVRALQHKHDDRNQLHPVISVSINHRNGNIVTLVGSILRIFDINGNVLAQQDLTAAASTTISPTSTAVGPTISSSSIPTCAVSTDCPEWMEDGVVAVTGHTNGEVRLWSLDPDRGRLVLRPGAVEGQPQHSSSPITALRVATDRPDHALLIGDASGRVSVCKTVTLDSYSTDELAAIVEELSVRQQQPQQQTPVAVESVYAKVEH